VISCIQRLFRNRDLDQQLDAELRFHVEQHTADHVAAGMSPREARRRALIDLGGFEQTKQKCRDVHWENHLESLYRDFHFAFRSLKKDRRFTFVAILTLALGIGSTTLIFSVIDCVVLHPFPYKNSGRLASFNILLPEKVTLSRFPVPAFLDFKEQNHVFEDMFGLAFLSVRYAGRNGIEQFLGGWATSNTFDVLDVKPLLGREITFADGNANSPPVFVMSYHLWATRFNRDPTVLGTSFTLNGRPRTLVAIMPPRFQIGECEIWMPLNLSRTTFITGFGTTPNELWAVGHLRPGVSSETAEADLGVIAKRLETTFPTYFRSRYKLTMHTLIEGAIGRFKLTLLALMAAVVMLLLIACSNVANLLLARATVREREIVIRAALGATRGRLMQQLLVESSALAAVSCFAGCVFAYSGLRVVVTLIPPDSIPAEVAITLNPAAVWFAIGVTVLTTLLCGLSPAIHSVGGEFKARLAGSGKGTSGAFRHGRLRSGLVIAEVALSIVLLISSGLMVRTLVALERVNIGFDPAKVLYAQLSLPEGRYETAGQQKVFFRRVLNRIAAIPGVIAATEATSFPPYSRGWTTVVVPGKTHAEPWGTKFDMCTEGYFETLGRQLLRGRLLSQSDVEAARQVTVVNQTLARDYFSNENPVGQRIKFSDFEMYADWPRNAYFEIIGVIADVKNHGLQDPPRPEAYFPYTLTATGPRGLMVRTGLNADSMLTAIRREISDADTDVVVVETGSIENVLRQSYYVGPQFTFATLGSFAVIGLLLVIVGIFSVVAYTVSLQTHDIGVRMALGARQSDILHMVIKKGLILVCTGIVIGVPASIGLTRFLASQLWGVSATDPWTFSVVVACIITVGLTACFFPARKASQVDPLITLRYE
jgi:putative ABC transport system permease protein